MNRVDFQRLVVALDKPMYATAAAMLRDADDAFDAVQETMISLWESRDRLDDVDNLKAFCMTALRRRCLDILKSFHSTRLSPIPDHFDTPDDSADTFTSIDSRQQLNRAMKLIDQLPENQRKALTLSAVNSLNNSEISEITGWSDQNVRTLLSRARSHLKTLFSSPSTDNPSPLRSHSKNNRL